MNDQTEALEQAVGVAIRINSPVGLAVTFLAAYGAKAMTNDVRRGVNKIRANRQAKKAEQVKTDTPQQ